MGDGESFGRSIGVDWLENDAIGFEQAPLSKDFGSPRPESLMELLGERLRNDIQQWQWCLASYTGILVGQLNNSAQTHILTAAANDAQSLLRQVDMLEGRAAALLSRSLFEHLVNFMDVTTSKVNGSERFLTHRYVVIDQLSQREWLLGGMSPEEQKKERRRLDKLKRSASKPLAEALKKYTKRFTRGWAEGSLADRAKHYGLKDGYIGYRVLSGVVHGSSGGLSGLIKASKVGETHRLGSDMELVALAYEEGLGSYLELVRSIRTVVDRTEVDELEFRTHALLTGFQEVRRVCARIDREMWPDNPAPLVATAVVAIFPRGTIKWYLYDLRDNTLTLAEPPASSPDLSTELELAEAHRPDLYNGRPFTFPRFDVTVTPRPAAPRFPSQALLTPANHPGNPVSEALMRMAASQELRNE